MYLGAPALFYMATAMITMIGACQFQAWLSVRGLRFQRVAPETARVGDLITVEITVWSEKKVRRPLVSLVDNLPGNLVLTERTPSLPIAPAYDLPIRTQYQFRPLRRGRYQWSGVTAEATDALGLALKRKSYDTAIAELTVLPRAIPVNVDMPEAAGWGISESESGQNRGSGLEPRGIRQYVPGDSIRHVHWRSTAKTGQLLVKEFEAGSQAAVGFVLQRTQGSNLGKGANTTLEKMVGNVVYLAETFLRRGARIQFPGLPDPGTHWSPHERRQEIYEVMAGVEADSDSTISEDALATIGQLPLGSILVIGLAVADAALPHAISELRARGIGSVVLIYDASFSQPGKRGRKSPNVSLQSLNLASDPSFVAALEESGASTVLVPVEDALAV